MTSELNGSAITAEIFFPEAPFGGVVVEMPNEEAITVEINTGSPVDSVFGRTGAITAEEGDYDEFYAPLGAGLPAGGLSGQVLSKNSDDDYDTEWITNAAAAVSSVFGRSGAVTALVGDYSAFYSLLGHTHAFVDITGKPTTLAGYGITDAYTKTEDDARFQPLDADLTAIAAVASQTAYGRGFLPLVDAAAARTYIGALGAASVDDTAYTSAWNGITTIAPSKNALYDQMELYYLKAGGALSGAMSISMASPSITLNPVSGSSVIDIRGTASTNDGIRLSATGTTGTYMSDTQVFKNRANTLTYGTFDSTGLNLPTGLTYKINGVNILTGLESTLTFQHSLSRATNTVNLLNDSASPGNSMLYGTNSSGIKGWYAQPAGGGGGNVSNFGTPTALQYSRWTDATHIEGVAPSTVKTDLALTKTDVGLSAVTNDAQIKASDFPSTSVDGEISLFSGTTGKAQKRATGSGLVNATAGVFGTLAAAASGKIIISDGTNWTASTPKIPAGSSPAVGKMMQSNGTDWVASNPTWPAAASPAAGKIVIADGTNFVASTPTYPSAAGSAGGVIVSDGTNFGTVVRPEGYMNGSAVVTSGFAANTIIPGSTITIPTAGSWKVGGSYHCTFDMTKTAAGTAAIAINVHMGTLGTTGDAIVATVTLAAGTAAIDFGLFDVYVTFRTVGSGTSALVGLAVMLNKNLTTTGLTNTSGQVAYAAVAGSGFNSTTQTKIGLGFNGGASFNGSVQICQTVYRQ